MSTLLNRLRELQLADRTGEVDTSEGLELSEQFIASGVKFVSSPDGLERVYYRAVRTLADCVKPDRHGRAVLQEGGVYHGCWLESTATINTEVLAKFCPGVSQATFEQFAELQREDGLLPYKVTADGPAFKQIQLVTPPARSVWKHYRYNGQNRAFLRRMYDALSRFDEWLATYRDTRGTGCVEAFCTYDTGHDMSSRFWHIPDTPEQDDPKRYDPHSPLLPLLAPDLTASVYCSRRYLALMADELGESSEARSWKEKAEQSLRSLYEHCLDEQDGFFYDVDKHGRFLRIQSDVLLRVLACEVGDDAFFAQALERYLLNTRKFFSKYPLTSVAMDDPRFDPFSTHNNWGGAVNFLTLIRTPQAFEHHGRYVELSWLMQPIISAMSRLTRFGQCISPWTGEEGYTEKYSPAILSLLDYVERLSGIAPTEDGDLWFTGLLLQAMDHGVKIADETAYSRLVDGQLFELRNTRSVCEIYRDGIMLCEFPYGVRVVTGRDGAVKRLIGMSNAPIAGALRLQDRELSLQIEGNEVLRLEQDELIRESAPGVILPTH